MIVFYSQNIHGELAHLYEEEARHCMKVLRKRVGDKIFFTDGLGYFYNGVIESLSKSECSIRILDSKKNIGLPYNLTIAISPIKNPSRYEWFVEKSVEIGVNKIVPLLCDRTEKKNIKQKRLENIIVSASKQSLKANFPILTEPISFNDFVEKVNVKNTYLAHLLDDTEYLGKVIKPKSEIIIMIGPEGDFSTKEITIAVNLGIKTVSLGTSRLRTETAGIVSCHIVNMVNEMY